MNKDDFVSRKAAVEAGMDAALEVINDADDPWKLVREIPIRAIVTKAIAAVPPADVKPVVRGKWIEELLYWDNLYTCSACGTTFLLNEGTPKDNEYNFCPKCGAVMDVNEEPPTP